MISTITITLSQDMHNGGALIFLTKFTMAFSIMFHLWKGFRCLILTRPDPNPNCPSLGQVPDLGPSRSPSCTSPVAL